MRLCRLELSNFRSFDDVSVELADLTVLIGPNDSGKSSVLDAIRFVCHDANRAGRPWRRSDVARPAWFEPGLMEHVGVESSPGLQADPDAPVTVVCIFDDLNEPERELFEPFLVEGVLRIGAYCPGWEDQARWDTRVGPCLLLPEGLVAAADATDATTFWRHKGTTWFWPAGPALRGGALLRVSLAPFPPVRLVGLPGPDEPPPRVSELLEPFIQRLAPRLRDPIPTELAQALSDAADQVTYDLSDALTSVVPRYLEHAAAAVAYRHDDDRLAEAARAIVGDVEVYVGPRAPGRDIWDPTESKLPPGSTPADHLGSGARRAVAMAALELYADPRFWPPTESALLLLEEPEVGLDAAAQRQVAAALRSLRTRSGVQAIIVTHSPVLIDAVDPEAVRLVRRDRVAGSRVHTPADLPEIAMLLGLRPSDVLLPAGFVVVEGPSDRAILETWARRLRLEIGERWRVPFVPAEGWTKASMVSALLELAHPGVRIAVVLDAGQAGDHEANRIARDFGDGVPVWRLPEREIEWYLSRKAVRTWLVQYGANPELAAAFPSRTASPPSAKAQLDAITRRAFGRRYQETQDGAAIAALMQEAEIALPIRELLFALAEHAGGHGETGVPPSAR